MHGDVAAGGRSLPPQAWPTHAPVPARMTAVGESRWRKDFPWKIGYKP